MSKAWLLLLCFFLVNCSTNCTTYTIIPGSDNTVLMWLHSDIQPHNAVEKKQYATAFKDISRLKKVDFAIVAGDIVQTKSEAHIDYPWYLNARNDFFIPYWYEIAGNHENRDIRLYKKYIRMELHYAVTFGNVLMIFMSDTDRSPYTVIPDEVFHWWKKLVIANQDKIIITVTHACLSGSKLLASMVPTLCVKNSKRFEEVIERYHVDLWISGHSHLSYVLEGDWSKPGRFKNTVFVDVSSIRKDGPLNSESYIAVLQQMSRELRLVPVDHTKRKFMYRYNVRHTLGHPFQWDRSKPVMYVMPKTP